MDLNQKAQWHLDFNGGMVPVLETPQGDLIKESAIIA
jgi:glutathione S-transferase